MKVRALHQIEVTSRCDLRCVYCPNPTLARPKVDMSRDDFGAAIAHVEKFYRDETQFELNLAGIGESTLHPDFPAFIRLARKVLPAIRIIFATNGLNLSWLHPLMQAKRDKVTASMAQAGAIVDALVDAQKTGEVDVFVSMHRPERAALAHEVLVEALGARFVGVSADPTINADDWAGQVKWKRTYQQSLVCQWLRDGKVMAMADGRITSCCLDASGAGVVGHVTGRASDWKHQAYSLCRTCQQKLPPGTTMPDAV